MRTRFSLWPALAALMVPAGIAAGQVESRCLPPEMPKTLFPRWVTQLPQVESQEVSPPLVNEKDNARNGSANAVKDLAGMAKEARATIELAQSGKYKEATVGGDALLRLPSHNYGDFTWDYLANATAWSHIQTGNLKAAGNAHSAAVARVVDTAILQYHRLAAAMLDKTEKSARQLKDYSTYRNEMIKRLATHLEGYNRNINAAKQSPLAPTRERCLKTAYDHLRVMIAADPDTGNELAKTSFREAADGLAKVIAPALLAEARRAGDNLSETFSSLVFERQFGIWNSRVKTLRNKVRHVKRICRMHDYLLRAKLASSTDANRIFREAHRLLFVPNNPRLVWQELGKITILNGLAHQDVRCRVPYQETKIAPFGTTATASQGDQAGWNRMGKMDGDMRKMDGSFNKMDGPFKKMDGSFKKMDGSFKKMDGKMGGDGFKSFR